MKCYAESFSPTSLRRKSVGIGKSMSSISFSSGTWRVIQNRLMRFKKNKRDFVNAVRTGESPKVDGAAGRDAIAVAERIVDCIQEHSWDGTTAGRRGAFAMPALPIIAGTTQPPAEHHERRRAG